MINIRSSVQLARAKVWFSTVNVQLSMRVVLTEFDLDLTLRSYVLEK